VGYLFLILLAAWTDECENRKSKDIVGTIRANTLAFDYEF
jgi:hypothetical protein